VEALVCSHVSKVFYEPGSSAPVTSRTTAARRWPLPRLSRTRRPVWAVKEVSFSVNTGEIFGILGPNGSGKSTLIRLIATLLIPDEGDIYVFGHHVVRERMAVRRLINRVSVDAAFFKKLSAWENLSYAARLYGVPPQRAYRLCRDMLSAFGFDEEKLSRPVENLSRGMQQKVSIARALLTAPRLLLLDEPTTGLDPKSKVEVQRFIRQLHAAHNSTIILTSHDMREVELLCQRVAIMNEGRMVALDTVRNLKQKFTEQPDKATLEEVFFRVTGKDWEEVLADA